MDTTLASPDIPARAAADYYAHLTAKGPALEARYRTATPRSLEAFERAARVFPGGYTRDAIMRGPHPTFVDAWRRARR